MVLTPQWSTQDIVPSVKCWLKYFNYVFHLRSYKEVPTGSGSQAERKWLRQAGRPRAHGVTTCSKRLVAQSTQRTVSDPSEQGKSQPPPPTWSSLIFFWNWRPRVCSSSTLLCSWLYSKSFLWREMENAWRQNTSNLQNWNHSISWKIETSGLSIYFLSLSSSCCLSFSRSNMDSWASFRSPSSFLLFLSRSTRSFFSCSKELSSCKRHHFLIRTNAFMPEGFGGGRRGLFQPWSSRTAN